MPRASVRNALLGLVDQIPLVGAGMTRAIEDRWPSRREREQAAIIEAQRARIVALERTVARANSLQGAQDRARQDVTLAQYQRTTRR